MRTVLLKHTRRRKFAELVTNHVLNDAHGDEISSVVHTDCKANHFRCDRRGTCPRFDHGLVAGLQFENLLQELLIDEGSFF